MKKHQKVKELVAQAYENSEESFAQWMWANHVPVVANKTKELAQQFEADEDLAVAGAWLHDFGDAFVHRHADDHEEISENKAIEVLKQSGYSQQEINKILEEIIAPHSCRDGFLPEIVEGKVLATADGLAHLTTDFYVQLAWKHLPENKNYDEFIEWVAEKLDRDFNSKIFFNQIKEEVRLKYEALVLVFSDN